MVNRLLLCLALLAALPAVARADQKAEVQARALFTEGNKRLDQGDYVGALEMYEAAYAQYPNAKILVNMGTALRNLGRNAEAADVYEKYLDDPAAKPELVKEVKKQLAELDSKLARLVIEVDEPGARVLLDGKEIGLSPQKISKRVESGPHMVAAEKEGFTPTLATVTLQGGEERSVQLKLIKQGNPDAGKKDVTPHKDVVVNDDGNTDPQPDATPEDDTPPPGVIHVAATRSHGGHLGALGRFDLNGNDPGKGAAFTFGITYGVGDRLELGVGGIASSSFGAFAGARFFLMKGAWKPLLFASVPLYFQSTGTLFGVHGGGGIQWDPTARIGVIVEVGVETFFNAPSGSDSTIFVPSAGLQLRL